MSGDGERTDVSRRAVLRASSGIAGIGGVGSARADDDAPPRLGDCPDATVGPSTGDCEGAATEGCADDHPATASLRSAVQDSLDENFPTVGALIDAGYVPYFDLVTSRDRGGWSHWLNPAFIGDGSVLNPERPESVLVDNTWWRPIGAMFVATRDGEPVGAPPAVYGDDDGAQARCAPWHYHAGLPGRLAWWKYQQLDADGLDELSLRAPCRTPCVLHVWTHPHPEGTYAHDAPPPENRGGPPAEPAGFDTEAAPGEDALGWEALPDALGRPATDRWTP